MATSLPRARAAAAAPPCCGASAAAASPRSAVGVDPDLKAANLKHLKRIEGQVRGIAAMIESDRYCADIITQVAAVRESLHSVARNLMRNHLKHCAPEALGASGPRREDMIDELVDLAARLSR